MASPKGGIAASFRRRLMTSLGMGVSGLHQRLNLWFRATAGGDGRPVAFDIDTTIQEFRAVGEEFAEIRGRASGSVTTGTRGEKGRVSFSTTAGAMK